MEYRSCVQPFSGSGVVLGALGHLPLRQTNLYQTSSCFCAAKRHLLKPEATKSLTA